MRILAGCGVALLLASGAFAQSHIFPASGFGNVAFPGIGRATFHGDGFGNVVFPGLGHVPRVNPFSITDTTFALRLGHTVSGFHPFAPVAGVGPAVAVPVAYPVYVSQPYPVQQQPNVIVVYPPPPSPVIINQVPAETVRTVTTETPPETPSSEQGMSVYQSPTRAAEAAPSTESPYYLIAFKDHSIYSAIAYWVEGDTLHYFTSGNTHNQASLSLVDRKLTEELNRQRSVDVRLPK